MRIGMRFEARSLTFNLSAAEIDRASEWLTENLADTNTSKNDRVRMRLLFEEALLNIAEHSGEETTVSARLERRWGRYRLRLRTKGDRFNPLSKRLEDDGLSYSLFSVIDLRAQYSYSVGVNVLRLSMPRRSMNPVLKIVIAIAIGALIGLLGNMVIPSGAGAFSEAVLYPIADMWVRLLQAISGPVIFLAALTATFGTKRIADFGGSRITTLARYFAISACVVAFAMLCSFPLYPAEMTSVEANGSTITRILDGVLQFVPGNLMEPFSSANTPQILLIAIVTGFVLATLESQVKELNAIIRQLNTLGLAVAKLVCALVPFFVGLLLCLRIWTHDTALLGSIWVPLVLAAAISVVAFLAVLLAASVRFRISPLLLARKLSGQFVKALKRGTLDFSAVDGLATSCEQLLGINGDYARATLPQGLFLYMPTGGVGICVFVLFAAQTQQLAVDPVWFASLAALSVVLAVATPPVTGANLLSFVVAFTYLGISSAAYLDVMVFDIVFGVLCIALDQAMLQIEMINQADRLGFLDQKVLEAPLS